MIFRQLFDPQSSTYTYLLADERTRHALLVDPVFEQARRDTALIEELYAFLYHSPGERFTYVHEWREGDLVIWDNHAVQHGRPEVGDRDARTLRRVCVGPEQDLSLFAGRRVS